MIDESLLDISRDSYVPAKIETARCAVREDGVIEHANDAFLKLLGLSEFETYNLLDIFSFSEDALDDDEPLTALESGEHDVHLYGNPVIRSFYFDWVKNQNNARYLIVSLSEDQSLEVAGRDSKKDVQSSISLRKPQDYGVFADLSHEMMVVMDEKGKIISCNGNFIERFIADPQTQENFTLTDFFHHDDQFIPDASITTYVVRMKARDGDVHRVEWRQKYDDGYIYASGRDITEIHEHRDDLIKRRQQLTEAEAIGHMGHWRWAIGEDYVSCSEEMARIFGYLEETDKIEMNWFMERVHKFDVGRVGQIFQRAMIEEKNYDMEFSIHRPDGQERYVRCEGRCEKDESGEVVALYGILQDMTERALHEKKLRAAKNAAEQAYAAKSRFLANMSHELRTPLNAIIGFSEMMKNQILGPIFNEKYLEYSASIYDSGQHLLDIITDILDMSKIEEGKYALSITDVRLEDVINRAFRMVEARASDGNVTLKKPDLRARNIILQADRRALLQIFLNILSNAVKFTREKGMIWVDVHESSEHVIIKIHDNGVGIPPNKLASVLKPFEQVSGEYTRNHEGTGLGLSITRELVMLHGGKMDIESTVDVGTTVTIKLPLKSG
ncbi:MAG: ATP-binding protein [Alphaproteobacteria bacterium]|nr:ATP-binding protein [Alphaproteobacteria bacterium]